MSVIEGFDDEQTQYKIEDEGFDYFFSYYVNSDKINDKELREAVKKYAAARAAIISRLNTLGIDVDV